MVEHQASLKSNLNVEECKIIDNSQKTDSFASKLTAQVLVELERAKKRGNKVVIEDVAAHDAAKEKIKERMNELEDLLASKPKGMSQFTKPTTDLKLKKIMTKLKFLP